MSIIALNQKEVVSVSGGNAISDMSWKQRGEYLGAVAGMFSCIGLSTILLGGSTVTSTDASGKDVTKYNGPGRFRILFVTFPAALMGAVAGTFAGSISGLFADEVIKELDN